VRAGFTPHLRRKVFDRVKSLHTSRCPFADLPNNKSSHWVSRQRRWRKCNGWVVVQIRSVEWTGGGHLRHAAFLGQREDKKARSEEGMKAQGGRLGRRVGACVCALPALRRGRRSEEAGNCASPSRADGESLEKEPLQQAWPDAGLRPNRLKTSHLIGHSEPEVHRDRNTLGHLGQWDGAPK
jgi:ATP dependent DNA ligase C terminal region